MCVLTVHFIVLVRKKPCFLEGGGGGLNSLLKLLDTMHGLCWSQTQGHFVRAYDSTIEDSYRKQCAMMVKQFCLT